MDVLKLKHFIRTRNCRGEVFKLFCSLVDVGRSWRLIWWWSYSCCFSGRLLQLFFGAFVSMDSILHHWYEGGVEICGPNFLLWSQRWKIYPLVPGLVEVSFPMAMIVVCCRCKVIAEVEVLVKSGRKGERATGSQGVAGRKGDRGSVMEGYERLWEVNKKGTHAGATGTSKYVYCHRVVSYTLQVGLGFLICRKAY